MNQSKVLGEIDISPLLKAKGMLDEAIATARSRLEKTGVSNVSNIAMNSAGKP